MSKPAFLMLDSVKTREDGKLNFNLSRECLFLNLFQVVHSVDLSSSCWHAMSVMNESDGKLKGVWPGYRGPTLLSLDILSSSCICQNL